MSRISVAMTTYNGEKYVEKQLLSLLEQTRPADEVIILDDRSSDNTPALVRDFISKHGLENWCFRINEENLGFKKNFHRAISLTTGDIIFLCDQDDLWHKDKLEVLEQIFLEHPEAMAVNASFRFIDGEDRPIETKKKRGTANNNLIKKLKCAPEECVPIKMDIIMAQNISPGCTMAFHRKVRNIYLETSSMILPHDWEINILAAKTGTLFFYNKSLISYRIHAQNTIGLETSHRFLPVSWKLNGFVAKRKEILKEQELLDEYLRAYAHPTAEKDKRYIVHYANYVGLRRKSVVHNSFIAWVKMWRYLFLLRYSSNITAKFLLGDLICVLRPQKSE